MTTNGDISQRQFKRHFFSTKAQLLFSNQQTLTVRTVDISQGGMAVISPNNLPLKLKSKIHFVLVLPPIKKQACNVEVQVMQSIFSGKEDGFKVGLKFLNVQDDFAEVLKEFLQE